VTLPAERTEGAPARDARERARLVRLCARLTGSGDAAEDLAQETLLEAWRNAHKLRDPAGRDRWLAAIARHVCRRWARGRGRELPRLVRPDASHDPADDFDFAVELERHELAELLDRALALLPPETRRVLVERYIDESPHAAIAARLGVSEDAVSMRLSRGKLLLRRVLTTALREEAAAYGFRDTTADGWRETRVWCPWCGRQRLIARVPSPPGTVSFRCPACQPDPDLTGLDYRLANAYFARSLGGLTRPRAILGKTAAWAHDYFRRAIAARAAECTHCGRPARLRLSLHEETSAMLENPHTVYVECEACGEVVCSSFGGLVASLPEVQRFWREQGRIRTLPGRGIDVAGGAALVTTFESVAGAARLDVVSARDTLGVIGIHGAFGT
jgi:RNA polymerase sigma-70 factor (ECF subfamily)